MNSDPVITASSLKARLARLDVRQTAALRRRLASSPSDASSRDPALGVIPRAHPVQVTGNPPVATFPASRGQQRLFFLQVLAPESSAYAVPVAFHLRGPLRVEWLQEALQAVVRRHHSLRTTFSMDSSGIVQRVADDFPIRLEHGSLEGFPAATLQEEADRRFQEAVSRPFDLEAGPLIRGVLLRIGPAEHLLLMVLHHIISDGWSRANLLRDLTASYGARAAGRPADLPPLSLQPADVFAWQTALEAAGGRSRQEAYWVAALSGRVTPLDFPAARPRPAMPSFQGDSRRRPLHPGLRTRLEARAGEEGATLFMILLAAFGIQLWRETGRPDLVVGTPIAGRPRVELEPLIGFFVNTLPLPVTIADGVSVRELLRQVRETTLNAHAHPDVPLDRLVERLALPRDPGRHPLVSVVFLIRYPAEAALGLPGIEATEWPVPTRTSKFDLTLAVELSSGAWAAVCEYNTDLFESPRVDRLLASWESLLEAMADNPDQPVANLIATAA
ncbi:MAG: hypothetical protein J0L84_01160 [Verrucomicrobia bacterium]|nr:hypothetical protein [Verrucomicrobiota bacterium]